MADQWVVPGHDAKTMTEYRRMCEEKQPELAGRNGWLIDWYHEPMPLENNYGTSMNPLLNSFAFPPEPPYEDPPTAAPAPSQSVLIFADSYGYASNIIKYAPKDRVGTRQFVTTAPGKLDRKKIDSLLGKGWDMIIFAMGIDDPKNNTSEEIHKTQQDVMHCLLHICKALSDNKQLCKYIAILTVDNFAEEREIHEQCGVGLVTNSTIFGFVNTARQEVDLPMQYIDTEWSLPETMMPYLSAEVFRMQTFGRNSVRILKSGRYVLRQINPVPQVTKEGYQNNCQLGLPESGVIAISGGNGGVAIIVGHWLLKHCAARGLTGIRFKFLSRSMKISEQNMPFWKQVMEDADKFGMKVEQAKGDVSNKDSVDQWVAEHASELIGFVHSAGVLADTLLFKIEWPDFDTVWNPKSRASLWLHEAFEKYGCPIKLFWMFSSVSVFGSMGQLNYSASNAFMDGLARHRSALGKAALVLAWGPWGEVGMATTLDENTKRRMAQGPMPYFTNAEGLDGMETVISSGYPQGQVYKINPDVYVGMVNQPQDKHLGQQSVNFYSNVLTPLPCVDITPANAYFVYQSMVGHAFNQKEGLVYKAFAKPRAKYDDDD